MFQKSDVKMTANVLSSKHALTESVRIHADDCGVQEMTSVRLTTMYRNANQVRKYKT